MNISEITQGKSQISITSKDSICEIELIINNHTAIIVQSIEDQTSEWNNHISDYKIKYDFCCLKSAINSDFLKSELLEYGIDLQYFIENCKLNYVR